MRLYIDSPGWYTIAPSREEVSYYLYRPNPSQAGIVEIPRVFLGVYPTRHKAQEEFEEHLSRYSEECGTWEQTGRGLWEMTSQAGELMALIYRTKNAHVARCGCIVHGCH